MKKYLGGCFRLEKSKERMRGKYPENFHYYLMLKNSSEIVAQNNAE
jgi:hypothetical protein